MVSIYLSFSLTIVQGIYYVGLLWHAPNVRRATIFPIRLLRAYIVVAGGVHIGACASHPSVCCVDGGAYAYTRARYSHTHTYIAGVYIVHCTTIMTIVALLVYAMPLSIVVCR